MTDDSRRRGVRVSPGTQTADAGRALAARASRSRSSTTGWRRSTSSRRNTGSRRSSRLRSSTRSP